MAKIAKVEGELVIKRAGGNEFSFYELDFELSDAVSDINQARSVIQAGLLHDRLLREVEGYKRWRTCQVIDFQSTDKIAPPSEMEQLLLECSQNGCMPENIGVYKTEENKIKALKRALEAHNNSIAVQKEKDKARALVELANS